MSAETNVDTVNGYYCPNDGEQLRLNNEVTGEMYCAECLTLFDPADECGDCGRPVVWDLEDDRYRHAADAARGCFLIGADKVLARAKEEG